jgi:hypothetical protein
MIALSELIAEQVADEAVQNKILGLLLDRIRQGATAPKPVLNDAC